MAQPTSRRQDSQISCNRWNQVSEEDKTFRSSYTAGKLDKVPVTVLHNARSDHTGIPGPFDKYICQDHVLYVNAQQRNYSKTMI